MISLSCPVIESAEVGKKTKSVNDNNNGSVGNDNSNNWLGFSRSPQIKMEVTSGPRPELHNHPYNHQSHAPSATVVPTTFYLSPSSPIFYGFGENGGFNLPLPLMAHKSHGFLSMMEGLSGSEPEGMVSYSSPKLEESLGCGTMKTHKYESRERKEMVLTLDSMYYHHDEKEGIEVQHDPYFSGTHLTPLEEETKGTQVVDCDTQVTTTAENELSFLKYWVNGQYLDHHALEQQMTSTVDGGASGSDGGVSCGDLQPLILSMSPGSKSSSVTAPTQISPSEIAKSLALGIKMRGSGKLGPTSALKKSVDKSGQRKSQYRGVTRHIWTGRYEAHLWDSSFKKEGQARKGRQVYLGGYDMEEKAARAYDLAALKYWGPLAPINLPLENYQEQLEQMKTMTRQEFIAHLRRRSTGFSRGASIYRGVTRHHQNGKWQARIGRVAGNKDLYLGTFSTQEEAAEAYDIAAIKFRGLMAVTNFEMSRYDVEKIIARNSLLAGDLAKQNRERKLRIEAMECNPSIQNDKSVQSEINCGHGAGWEIVLNQSPQQHQTICDENQLCVGNYESSPFTMALQDLTGIDSINSSQPIMDESATLRTHFSNPSSLVTSLNSSREASPAPLSSLRSLF